MILAFCGMDLHLEQIVSAAADLHQTATIPIQTSYAVANVSSVHFTLIRDDSRQLLNVGLSRIRVHSADKNEIIIVSLLFDLVS